MDLEAPAFTFEGQVVALADEIAQCTHDLEDGVRSGIISFDDICADPLVQQTINDYSIPVNMATKTPAYDTRMLIIKNMVGYFINDACVESRRRVDEYINSYAPNYADQTNCIREKCIVLSTKVEEARERLYKDMIKNRVICSEQISISDSKSEYLIRQLFKAFHTHPKQLPNYVLEKYCKRCGIEFNRASLNVEEFQTDPKFIRAICDHISGMTDQFAAREYNRLYMPDYQ